MTYHLFVKKKKEKERKREKGPQIKRSHSSQIKKS